MEMWTNWKQDFISYSDPTPYTTLLFPSLFIIPTQGLGAGTVVPGLNVKLID